MGDKLPTSTGKLQISEPSTVSQSLDFYCLPDSPSNELVASIEGGRGKAWMLSPTFAGSRCHFLFQKFHQMLGAYHLTRWWFQWSLDVSFNSEMIQVERVFSKVLVFRSNHHLVDPPWPVMFNLLASGYLLWGSPLQGWYRIRGYVGGFNDGRDFEINLWSDFAL